MRKPLALAAALLLSASLAAACSDDDDNADTSTNVESADGTDSTDTTSTAGDDATTTSGTGPVVGSDPDSEFCQAARAFAADPSLGTGDFDAETTAHAVSLLEDLRDAAPEDLQDDLQVVIDGYGVIAQAMEEAGDDLDAQQAAVAGLADQLDALNTASNNVSAFTEAQCGSDVGASDTGDAATTTTAP